MKRIEIFQMFSSLFQFKTITDEKGNEYVLFEQNSLSSIKGICDRTEFEACENHVHLFDNLKKDDFSASLNAAEVLAQALLDVLRFRFPQKHFFVYVTAHKGDSIIIRFHQKWENEEPYFDPIFSTPIDRIFKIES